MSKYGQKPQGVLQQTSWSNSFRSFRTVSRIVSSGASSFSSTVRSAASAASLIVDRDNDQVQWAGFDKFECDANTSRKVLLLGYLSGFQIWDVEDADNVCNLVTRYDGPVSFLQMVPKPLITKWLEDKFVDSRPLLVICSGGPLSGRSNSLDGLSNPSDSNENNTNFHAPVNASLVPTIVRFYSLQSQSYVHVLKFRSVVYSVRCSARVVAISQPTQINCLNAATLEREYTILTNPIVSGSIGCGGIGYGPLAVGCRWLAYSGIAVVPLSSGRVNPQNVTHFPSFPNPASNGKFVAQYAKESGKQLAAGIVNLGDVGCKKLYKYCSELLSDHNDYFIQPGIPGSKANGIVNGHLHDGESVGMVVVRDIVTKTVITQFKAHKSPISALCFDPSGTLLVTASVQGHNINVFRIMPSLLHGSSSTVDVAASYIHLYRLQRGFTNAVIQDISFSDDSRWIMITSSRGTSHLFAVSPSAEANSGPISSGLNITTKTGPGSLNQQRNRVSAHPVTLSAVSRIRCGNNVWRSTVSSAAVAATGRQCCIPGHIASSFHTVSNSFFDFSSFKSRYHLLVFSPSGCIIQYVLRVPSGFDSATITSGMGTDHEPGLGMDRDPRLFIEAIQKWNICHKQIRRGGEGDTDIYGEDGSFDGCKSIPKGMGTDPKTRNPMEKSAVAKENRWSEDRHHFYISEAELQMHQARVPLWAKPEAISVRNLQDGGGLCGGEIEIEKIPTRMIEGRSKDLVPVFEYSQPPRFQPSIDSKAHTEMKFVNNNNIALVEDLTMEKQFDDSGDDDLG